MDGFKRLERWQGLCAALSVVGLLVTGAVVFALFPQTNAKLAKQLTAAECLPVRALPASEISPQALSKERYALYMQCDELFWYRTRYPQSDLTLVEYQSRLKTERQALIVRALLYWLVGVTVLFLTAFVLVRAIKSMRQSVKTPRSAPQDQP